MTKTRVLAILGVAGLSLLLAGCAGLWRPQVPEAVAIAPADPAAVAALDPRLLGQGMIEPSEDYFPDRIIVGISGMTMPEGGPSRRCWRW
jgi:hypothetical protein